MDLGSIAYIIFFVVVLVALFACLSVIRARRLIEQDLQDRGLRLMSAKWRPLAWWAINDGAQAFVVTYMDVTGTISTGRCSIWWKEVQWIPDEAQYFDGHVGLLPRFAYALFAATLALLGLRYLIRGELVFTSRLPGHATHISGAPLTLICGAAFAQAANFLIHACYVSPSWKEPRVLGIVARLCSFVAVALAVASLVVFACQHFS